ncbi:phosphatidate cytidylyltransferase [Pelistega indica]|uniref:Phosphatidate cytidylyltransferase n=1 Tax=Pelistega indica TaxID=1414851 RepID=V8G237_9BURK|nr:MULTISPECIES: phosphatidate cytidylyltransferase [Pelistega]ETD70584.1 phosphatidate cytidylyltransferase [Pelistega indica]
MFSFWQKLFVNVPDKFWWVLLGIAVILSIATLIGRRLLAKNNSEVIVNLNQRINAWWAMVVVLVACFIFGKTATLILYAVLSFLALREFMTLTPTDRSDYWALVLCFYLIIPLQYILISTDWYGMFVIGIPVYGFIIIPTILALSGNTEQFFERTAKIQWGMMLTIYCLSYAPALLLLTNVEYEGQGLMLLLYLLVVVQLSDVFQYIVGKLVGKKKIAPNVSPNKTVEGFIGGSLMAIAVGTSLWWITPFSVGYAALFSFIIVICGFFGGLSLSAVKRSLGAKDWGHMISGHGGVMDRIDSVLFAAPVFFHVVRYTYF